jgi:DNA-binding GntR family transcriptional regulator
MTARPEAVAKRSRPAARLRVAPRPARLRASAPRGQGSLADRAYVTIKEMILALELRPGLFLNELALCQMLGIGRTPVHQAVHRLMAEGLLDVVPRKGLIIRPDSLNEILALLEARTAVEPNIAGLAAERATADQVREMERLLRESAKRTDQRRRAEFMAIDRAFHARIAEAAGNLMLVDAQRPLHERSSRIWHSQWWQDDDLKTTQAEHAAILDGIARGDRQAAARAMAAHLESLRRRIVRGRGQRVAGT